MNLKITLKPCIASEQINQLEEAVENLINTQYKGIIKSVEWKTIHHTESVHLNTMNIIDMIPLQVTALEIDNKKPKFIVMSRDVYKRMCDELTNYHRCPIHPIEYMGIQIVIDTYADPTTLRVLPEVHQYG